MYVSVCLCTHFKGSVDHIADMNKDSAVSGNKHFLWSGVCCAGLCSVYFRTASREKNAHYERGLGHQWACNAVDV